MKAFGLKNLISVYNKWLSLVQEHKVENESDSL